MAPKHTDARVVVTTRASRVLLRTERHRAEPAGRPSGSGLFAPDQIRPRARTASRSSSSSLTEASMRVRENSLMSRPWTIS